MPTECLVSAEMAVLAGGIMALALRFEFLMCCSEDFRLGDEGLLEMSWIWDGIWEHNVSEEGMGIGTCSLISHFIFSCRREVL